MKLDIPAGIFDGYIFDLDGTLIDTMPIHFRAWDQALRQLGSPKPLSRELFYSLAGVPTRKVAEQLIREYQLTADPARLFHLKEELFVGKLDFVQPIEAVVEFARAVATSHPVAVASGGPREVVQHSLKLSGLDKLFPIVISADDVVNGKPAPDMFLLAAQRMGVPPSRCLVFEDGEPGIRAAAAAGMQVVRVESRA